MAPPTKETDMVKRSRRSSRRGSREGEAGEEAGAGGEGGVEARACRPLHLPTKEPDLGIWLFTFLSQLTGSQLAGSQLAVHISLTQLKKAMSLLREDLNSGKITERV